MIRFPVNNSMFMLPKHVPESAWLGHIPFAGWLIEAMRPQILVELGTHRGASFLAFCQAIETCAIPTKCYAVDTWQGDEHAGQYGDEIYFSLLDYQQRNYADFAKLMRMRFEEAVEYFEDGSVDLLHIDGLHTYDAVQNDFETWRAKLSARGVVLFHDINVRERGFGVWKYWLALKDQFPSFEFIHTHGLGVILVGPDQPEMLLELCRASASEEGQALVNRMFEHSGRLITSIVDIGTLAREQGRLADLLNHSQNSNTELSSRLDEFGAIEKELSSYKIMSDQKAHAAELQALVLHGCDEEVRRLNEKVVEVNVEIERMRSSLSWRLMSPLRAMRRMFVRGAK